MRNRFAGVALALAIAVLGIPGLLQAQGLTGQISGTVTDATGGVLPGVTVTIRNVGTGLTRETVTGRDGAFVFPDLLAGTFDLTVTLQGFKTYEQKGIVLGATERLALRAIALDVGGLTETVTVQSEAVQVQTTNGARSGLITRDNDRGHRPQGARLRRACSSCCPGVIDTRNREAPGWENMNNLSINGRTSFNFSYDGVTNKDTGQNGAQLCRAGARFDRRNPRADVEFPGRVRPQLRRDDHGRHAQRLEGLSRQRGVLQARRRVERQRVPAPHPVRPGSDGAVRAAALHVRQHRVDARRTGAHPEDRLQQGPQQAVLLLVAGHPRRAPTLAT